jgi:dipeptidase E
MGCGSVRLYLSSFRIGRCPGRLRGLTRGEGSACIIANAMDGQPADQRREGVDHEVVALSELGFRPEHLDLRDFDRDDVGVVLEEYNLLWLRGNVFLLRYALARSRADEAIVQLLTADSVCYGGYSAGPCVLGGSLVEFAEVDDTSVVTPAYGEPALERGLGILDWVFIPHTIPRAIPKPKRAPGAQLCMAPQASRSGPFATERCWSSTETPKWFAAERRPTGASPNAGSAVGGHATVDTCPQRFSVGNGSSS